MNAAHRQLDHRVRFDWGPTGAAAIASGPFLASSCRYLFTVCVRSPGWTTACTRPISFACEASKRQPVMNSSRAADWPILATTYGAMTAGISPSFTSVKPNIASSDATAMSATAASPAPPPSAAP